MERLITQSGAQAFGFDNKQEIALLDLYPPRFNRFLFNGQECIFNILLKQEIYCLLNQDDLAKIDFVILEKQVFKPNETIKFQLHLKSDAYCKQFQFQLNNSLQIAPEYQDEVSSICNGSFNAPIKAAKYMLQGPKYEQFLNLSQFDVVADEATKVRVSLLNQKLRLTLTDAHQNRVKNCSQLSVLVDNSLKLSFGEECQLQTSLSDINQIVVVNGTKQLEVVSKQSKSISQAQVQSLSGRQIVGIILMVVLFVGYFLIYCWIQAKRMR